MTQKTTDGWDAIVIGSGMGGMSCAASLAKFGKRVLVLEQHYVAGGFTHTFSRKGFHWDVGVHCLGEMEPNRVPGKLVDWLSDGKIAMESLGNVYDRFFFPDGFVFDLPSSSREYRANLLKAFPDESKVIDAYLDRVREAAKAGKPRFGMRLLPAVVEGALEATIARRGAHWWSRTLKEVLDDLTSNQRLKAVLAGQWGYYGSPPSRASFALHALVVRHFWNGGFYPRGGSSVFAEHFLAGVKAAGGDVWTRASVDQVLVHGGRAVGVRVTRAGKETVEVRAPIVISAAGARATVERLLPESEKASSWAKEITSLSQSPAHLCLNLGFEGDIAEVGATAANQWFFETLDMEWETWDVRRPDSIAPILYVSYPSLKDPLYTPGTALKHTGEAVTFVPWDAFAQWKGTRRGFRDKEYQEFKKGIETRMLEQLRRHIPKIMEKVTYHELATPLSTTHFTRAPEGAIYGLEPTPQRFACRKLRPKTPVRGLYLAGADVATLGVVGALMGGVMTAASIEPRVLPHLR